MPEPVIVTAVFTAREGRRDDLLAALRIAVAEVHGENGCWLYALHDAADGTVVMLEKWDSADDLAAHAAGDPVKRLDASIEELVVAKPVVITMSAVAAGTPAQGAL